MPIHNNRYPCIVGEHFWKLAAYIDSIPSRLEERLPISSLTTTTTTPKEKEKEKEKQVATEEYKKPHIFISGPPGCGKSYLLAATSTLLTIVPSLSIRKSQNSFLNSDYKSVFIGDCSRWIQSSNPLEYFRVELLAALQNANKDFSDEQDHRSPSHIGCLLCIEPFSRLEQLKKFLERCCLWQEEHEPDTNLLFFFDQVESLTPQTTLQNSIIQILLDLRLPILIFSSTSSSITAVSTSSPSTIISKLQKECSLCLEIPNAFNREEFNKLLSFHSSTIRLPDPKSAGEHHLDSSMMSEAEEAWKELRIWSGGNPLQVSTIYTIRSNTKKNTWEALSIYAEKRRKKQVLLTPPPPPLQQHQQQQQQLGKSLTPEILSLLFCIVTRLPICERDLLTWAPKNLLSLLHPWNVMSCFTDTSNPSRPLVVEGIPTPLNLSFYLSIVDSICRFGCGGGGEFLQPFTVAINWILKGKHSFLCNETISRTLRFYRQFQLTVLLNSSSAVAADVKFDQDIWSFRGAGSQGIDFLRKGKFMLIIHGGICPCDPYFKEEEGQEGTPSPFGPLKEGGRLFIPYSTMCQMFDFVIVLGDEVVFYSSNPSIYDCPMVLKYCSGNGNGATSGAKLKKTPDCPAIVAMEAWKMAMMRRKKRKNKPVTIKLVTIENTISKYRSDDFGGGNNNITEEPSPSHPLPLFTKALMQQFLKKKK